MGGGLWAGMLCRLFLRDLFGRRGRRPFSSGHLKPFSTVQDFDSTASGIGVAGVPEGWVAGWARGAGGASERDLLSRPR